MKINVTNETYDKIQEILKCDDNALCKLFLDSNLDFISFFSKEILQTQNSEKKANLIQFLDKVLKSDLKSRKLSLATMNKPFVLNKSTYPNFLDMDKFHFLEYSILRKGITSKFKTSSRFFIIDNVDNTEMASVDKAITEIFTTYSDERFSIDKLLSSQRIVSLKMFKNKKNIGKIFIKRKENRTLSKNLCKQ